MKNQTTGVSFMRWKEFRTAVLLVLLGMVVFYCWYSSPPPQPEYVEANYLKDAFTSGRFVAVVQQTQPVQAALPANDLLRPKINQAGIDALRANIEKRLEVNTSASLMETELFGYRTWTQGREIKTVSWMSSHLTRLECSDGIKITFQTNDVAAIILNQKSPPIEFKASAQICRSLQVFHDNTGFAINRDTCGPLRLEKFAPDGRLIYQLGGESHAHSWGILAPKSAKLCMWIYQHTATNSCFEVYDWNTGKKLKTIILYMRRIPETMAIDTEEKYIFVQDEKGRVERVKL